MGCPEEATLVHWLEGGLPDSEQALLEQHLDACSSCSEVVATLAAFSRDEGDSGPGLGGAAEKVGGRYRLRRLVGVGAMGSVYEAFDETLGRRVAVKILRGAGRVDAGRRVRLIREAKLLASIHHPHVLGVYDVGEHHGEVFMVTQFVEGTTLRSWIVPPPPSSAAPALRAAEALRGLSAAEPAPGWRTVLEAYLQAASGLEAAHRLGLVHRDVKPDNLLVDAAGTVFVADFGLSYAIGASARVEAATDAARDVLESRVTRAGTVLGTPLYMPPEQHRRAEVSPRADQFSFAASLLEALTGERPFVGTTPTELAEEVSKPKSLAAKSRPGGPPVGVFRVIERALAPNVNDRYASMTELAAALVDAARPSDRARPRSLGRAVTWGGATVGVTVSVVAALVGRATVGAATGGSTGDVAAEATAPTTSSPPGAAPSGLAPSAFGEPHASGARPAWEDAARACRAEVQQCGPLVQELRRRFTDEELEGVVHETEFRAVAVDLAPELAAACRGGQAAACPLAAYALSFRFHDSDIPEGAMIPDFLSLVSRGCELGDYLACTSVRDAYAAGAFRKEGPFAVDRDVARLTELIGAGCRSGASRAGRSCWLLAEALWTEPSLGATTRAAARWISEGCDRSEPVACLFDGVLLQEDDAPACAARLREAFRHFPENAILDDTRSWSEVEAFCRRAATLSDPERADRSLAKACALGATAERGIPGERDRAASAAACRSMERP